MKIEHQIFLVKKDLFENLDKARFLLCRTYPLVQEQKLFLSVFQTLVDYYDLFEDYLLMALNIEKKEFQQELDKVAIRRKLLSNEKILKKIMGPKFELTVLITQKSQLQELLEAQKTGPANFARKKDYIICEKNYKVRVISESSALGFLQIAEEFGQFL